MNFCSTDWILLGYGHIYSPPFVSGNLLYRLIDINRSLLFCERLEADVVSEQNNRIVSFRPIINESKRVLLYASLSAETSLADFSAIPPIEMRLDDLKEYVWDGLTISLAPVKLPASRSYMLRIQNEERKIYKVEGTSYSIHCPAPILPIRNPDKKKNNPAFFSGYQISVSLTQQNRFYQLGCDLKWMLSAVRIGHQWKRLYEATLGQEVR